MDLIKKLVELEILKRSHGFDEEIFREHFQLSFLGVEIESFPSDVDEGLYRLGMLFLRKYIKEDLTVACADRDIKDDFVILARIGGGLTRDDERKIDLLPPIDDIIKTIEPSSTEMPVVAYIQRYALNKIKEMGQEVSPEERYRRRGELYEGDIPF